VKSLQNVAIAFIISLLLIGFLYQSCEYRAFKAAWAKDAAAKDRVLLSMQAGMAAINDKHDPAIADIQADIAQIKLTTADLKSKLGGIHMPTVADVLAMAGDISVACEERLASTVQSFTTCKQQSEAYATLTLSQDTEIKNWVALDVERQAKDRETQVAFKECLTNYQKQAAALILAQRNNHWLIVYAGAGGSVFPDGKVYPSLQIGIGVKLLGLIKKPGWL
jgi:hypothetical protein